MSAQTSLEEHKMNKVIFSMGKIQAVRKRLLQLCVHKGKKMRGEFLLEIKNSTEKRNERQQKRRKENIYVLLQIFDSTYFRCWPLAVF